MTDKTQYLKQLWPIAKEEVSLFDAYATTSKNDTTYLRINMVSSIDGAISIKGKAIELSSDIDRVVFHSLRSFTDLVLVGAGTMRIEEYKPVSLTIEEQSKRIERNQKAIPPIAVVTRSGEFNFTTDFFSKAVTKPIIITTEIGARVAQNNGLADIIICGKSQVDLNFAIKELNLLGYKNILCEGGPSLNADLLKENLVDELCLTINPILVQGDGKRIFDGPIIDTPKSFKISNIFTQNDQLFFRYTKKTD